MQIKSYDFSLSPGCCRVHAFAADAAAAFKSDFTTYKKLPH